MAIVNHNSDVILDETWANTDEHHVTLNFTVGNVTGGATITVEEDQAIYWDGAYPIAGINQVDNIGHFYAVASDWAHKITIQPDPTLIPEPRMTSMTGINTSNKLFLTERYVHTIGALYGVCHVPAANSPVGDRGDIDVQFCVTEMCQNVLYVRNSVDDLDGADLTWKNCIQLNCYTAGFYPYGTGDPGTIWSGNFDVEQIYSIGCDYHQMFKTSGTYYDFPFDFTRWVFISGKYITGLIGYYWPVGDHHPIPDFSECYFAWQDPYEELVMDGCIQQDQTAAVTFTECVEYRSGALILNTSGTGSPWYPVDFEVIDCDFIENRVVPLRCRDGMGLGKITNSYLYYNNRALCVEPGGSDNEIQYKDCEAGVTLRDTPNMPLEINNISEGSPGQNSITITFDSKAGPSGTSRCYGSAFIKYGVAPGFYTECTIFPSDFTELSFAWTRIKTEWNEFVKTGHSVTINNLKPNTTYYYKPCFVDPVGRIAEGPEGSFRLNPPVTESLLAWWPHEEGEGVILHDVHAGENGDINGAGFWDNVGPDGNPVGTYDGATNFVDGFVTANFDIASGGVSIVAALRVPSLGDYKYALIKAQNYTFWIGPAGGIGFNYKSGAQVHTYQTNDGVIEAGEWYIITIAFTYNSPSSLKIYRNLIDVTEGSWTEGNGTGLPNIGQPIQLGRWATAELWYTGRFGDTLVYAKQLSYDNVVQNFSVFQDRYELGGAPPGGSRSKQAQITGAKKVFT